MLGKMYTLLYLVIKTRYVTLKYVQFYSLWPHVIFASFAADFKRRNGNRLFR